MLPSDVGVSRLKVKVAVVWISDLKSIKRRDTKVGVLVGVLAGHDPLC